MLLVLVPLSLSLLAAARLHHSRVPEDPYAFPKYRVSFLNGLPVLNETADRWVHDGLRGGEDEFLDRPNWREANWHSPPLKSIEGSDERSYTPDPSSSINYSLQRMKLGPKSTYLCLIPPPPHEPPVLEEPQTEVSTPVHSWALLQPLSETCLYHRQGWFTYSYCHNSHVRQFRELHNQQIPSPGAYKPEEDPDWEAYTLGRAPPTLEAGAELTTTEAAAAANLELARGAGSRYLVQRWGDGTYCDKTGRKREVEIQFHCSMTMADTILFVKETQTCHYVLHIATPRLCGEPGFKTRIDAEEERYIRCREVLDEAAYERADRSLPPAPRPISQPLPNNKVIAPPPPPPVHEKTGGQDAKSPHGDLLRKAVERILAHQGTGRGDSHVVVEKLPDGDGEILVEYIDLDIPDDAGAGLFVDGELVQDRMMDILKAAGYQLKGYSAADELDRDHPQYAGEDEDEDEGGEPPEQQQQQPHKRQQRRQQQQQQQYQQQRERAPQLRDEL